MTYRKDVDYQEDFIPIYGFVGVDHLTIVP